MGKTICISETFWESCKKLGKKDQVKVKKTMDELGRGQTSPSLNIHSIEGGNCDKKFLSARVNRDLRIIFVYRDSMCTLLYVDHHDKAYEWCNGKFLEKTNFGDEYIYDSILAQKKIEHVKKAKEIEGLQNSQNSIFSKLSITKSDLIELGVQVIHAENLMLLEDDEVLDYIEIFPYRLQEALFDIVTETKSYDEARRTLFAQEESVQNPHGEFVTMDIDEFEGVIETLSNEIKRQSESVADGLRAVSSYNERIKNIEERFEKIEAGSMVVQNDYNDNQKKRILENYAMDSNRNMIMCSKCGKEIYINAQFCVNCGCMMPEIIADYEKKEVEKKEQLRLERLSRLSELERVLYDAPDYAVESYGDFNDRDLTLLRTHFSNVDKMNFFYFNSLLTKLTSDCLIEWVMYNTFEDSNSLSKILYTKVCGVGIVLEVLCEYDSIGEYMIFPTFRIQDSETFKLGEVLSAIDIKIIKIIDSMYPQFSIRDAIKQKSEKCKKEYVNNLSAVEKYLYYMDSTKEIIEQRIEGSSLALEEEKKNIIQKNTFADEYDEVLLEDILISLSEEHLVKWHEFSIKKIENGCEGIYVAKINDTGVIAKIVMLYKDEKRATIRGTYAFQKKDYCLGGEHRVKGIIKFRDVLKATADSYTLAKEMKGFIENRTKEYEDERLRQEELARKRAEEVRLAAIPKLDMYSIFETHNIPGLESISLYELYFKNRKRFDELINNQEVIVDSKALSYLKGLNERFMSIRQKMYGIDNPIIAQLERHGEYGFIVPDTVLQKALDNGYVELTIGNLYSNYGPEYYEIHYGQKLIKSTKGIAVGKKGKWKGSVIESN